MPMTLKVSTFSTVFAFQVLIYENVTYLIYFWKQNFISLNLPLVKGNGLKRKSGDVRCKNVSLVYDKSTTMGRRNKSEPLLSRVFCLKY